MNSEPKNIDVLQNLEATVVSAWHDHPEMTDHVVGRAYEAAFERYRAEARGHPPKPPSVTGLDRTVFDAITEMCEHRLGRGTDRGDEIKPLPVPEMVDCLRELKKSVERHTRMTGRQGYLSFISKFV